MIIYMEMGRDFGRIGMIRARERIHIEEVLCEYSSFFLGGKVGDADVNVTESI